jgi:hypothetical protein
MSGSGLLSCNLTRTPFRVSQILSERSAGEIHASRVRKRDQAVAPKLISAQLDALKFAATATARNFATPLRRRLKPSLLQIKPRLKAGPSA